jgi:glycosyltransferase involved in cell wall biosynthesis
MAMKIPVVASPVSHNKQIIQHNFNGFFANNDNEWINYLNQLIFDSNKRKSMGMTGYKFVKKNFSIEYAAKDILKIIS